MFDILVWKTPSTRWHCLATLSNPWQWIVTQSIQVTKFNHKHFHQMLISRSSNVAAEHFALCFLSIPSSKNKIVMANEAILATKATFTNSFSALSRKISNFHEFFHKFCLHWCHQIMHQWQKCKAWKISTIHGQQTIHSKMNKENKEHWPMNHFLQNWFWLLCFSAQIVLFDCFALENLLAENFASGMIQIGKIANAGKWQSQLKFSVLTGK